MEKNTASYQTIVIELENLFISYGHNTGKNFLAQQSYTIPRGWLSGFPWLHLWVKTCRLCHVNMAADSSTDIG